MTASERAARLAAAAAIAASVMVAAVWAFVVPIFQAPDEPAHFDYAMSILRAGRLIRVTDGPKVWIATKDVQYLLQATDFDRVAWHSTMREPADYGTRKYFSRLDAGAPPVNAAPQPPERINYITTSYPYGFYALEAIWMWAIGRLTGSITSMFFAARLLCVTMLGIGLICNYYTALLLGMRRWPAAGFVAAVGLLPLTSFVSSYVQPDNLSYALLSASIVCAAALARRGIRPWLVVGMSLSLAALAMTKYQFFIAAALPCYGLLAAILWRSRGAATALWSAVAVVTSLVVFAMPQHWVGGASSAADWVGESNGLGLFGTMAAAPARAASAFTDCFISGLCAATYWQVAGWFDTPIVIGTWKTEVLLRGAISLASLLGALAVLALALRNGRRLVVMALGGHAPAAVRIALSDPAFNTYALFLAAMVALYIVTNNAFTAEGRHFYPVAFVALLGFVWYAPRIFGQRKIAARAASTALVLSYSLVAAGFALNAVSMRYYGAPVNRGSHEIKATDRNNSVSGALWPVQASQYGLGHPSSTFNAPQSRSLSISGLAAFPQRGVAASGVSIVVDQLPRVAASTEMFDATVAEGSGNRNYAYSEFWAPVVGTFREGAHIVRAYARDPGSDEETALPPLRPFFVVPNVGGRFSPSFERRLDASAHVAGHVEFQGPCKGTAWLSHSLPTMRSTGVALFRVTLSTMAAPDAVVWLDVGRSPYPTRRVGFQSFVGSVPLRWLGLGEHTVSAVVTRPTGRSLVVSAITTFRTEGRRLKPLHYRAPYRRQNCDDPLLELDGLRG